MITKKLTITKDSHVTLTTFIHEVSEEMGVKKRPGMLILPGGGYEFCSDREAEPIAIAYYNKGFNCYVLRYSVKEKATFPRPLKDAEAAMTYITKHADQDQTNRSKIATIGFSAGGHLAGALATMSDLRPQALLLGYPALIKSEEQGWPFPTITPDKNTPPSFLFHTYTDNVVPIETSLYFIHECRKQGIPVEFHLFNKGPHGLSLGTELVANNNADYINAHYAAWFELSVEWLLDVLDVKW
ncbi:MAG: alpha/beta hydrolase [Candidatus Izimaplasma sp.]|nr:alpha/beta hydrolase [Candidatus Izimaplasma bacterium]